MSDVPGYVTELRRDVFLRRQALDQLEASLDALYGVDDEAIAALALAEVERPTPKAPRKVKARPAAVATDAPADVAVDGKYDATIRRVLRDAGELGAAIPDIVHGFFPNGRYTPEEKKTAHHGIYQALRVLEARGEVTREARIWRLVEVQA